jgi:antitoxin component YwqK of YwqJK toxin-antitoxin module
MRLLLVLTFAFSGFTSFAQKDTSCYYLNASLQMSTDPNAVYVGKFFPDGELWKFIVRTRSNRIVLRSSYLDSNMQTLDGPYEVFYENGNPKTKGTYSAGKKMYYGNHGMIRQN